MKKILLALLLLSGCGGGGSESAQDETVVTPPPPNNPDAGTILDTTCEGTTLIETIADGNGGSTTEETPN